MRGVAARRKKTNLGLSPRSWDVGGVTPELAPFMRNTKALIVAKFAGLKANYKGAALLFKRLCAGKEAHNINRMLGGDSEQL